jgi:hypothetical protein
MKLFKKLLLGLLALIALLLVIAVFLPSKYHVARQIVIRARPDAIYPWVNNIRKWPEWTAWNKDRDPTLTFSYEGPPEGTGAVSKWDGKKTGNGMMTFTECSPASGVKYDLSFEHGKYKSVGGLSFEPSGDATQVTWADDGDLGANPISRYFGLAMDHMIGPDFEAGLRNLKQKVESK